MDTQQSWCCGPGPDMGDVSSRSDVGHMAQSRPKSPRTVHPALRISEDVFLLRLSLSRGFAPSQGTAFPEEA